MFYTENNSIFSIFDITARVYIGSQDEAVNEMPNFPAPASDNRVGYFTEIDPLTVAIWFDPDYVGREGIMVHECVHLCDYIIKYMELEGGRYLDELRPRITASAFMFCKESLDYYLKDIDKGQHDKA